MDRQTTHVSSLILGQSRSWRSLFSQWSGQCYSKDEMLGRNKRIAYFTSNEFTLLSFYTSSNIVTISHSERLTNSFFSIQMLIETKLFFSFQSNQTMHFMETIKILSMKFINVSVDFVIKLFRF